MGPLDVVRGEAESFSTFDRSEVAASVREDRVENRSTDVGIKLPDSPEGAANVLLMNEHRAEREGGAENALSGPRHLVPLQLVDEPCRIPSTPGIDDGLIQPMHVVPQADGSNGLSRVSGDGRGDVAQHVPDRPPGTEGLELPFVPADRPKQRGTFALFRLDHVPRRSHLAASPGNSDCRRTKVYGRRSPRAAR